jgi:hypothetical protein
VIVAVRVQVCIDPDQWAADYGLFSNDAETVADDVAAFVTDCARHQLRDVGAPIPPGGGVSGAVIGKPRK